MKNTSIRLFYQVLDLKPKRDFEEIIMKHDVFSKLHCNAVQTTYSPASLYVFLEKIQKVFDAEHSAEALAIPAQTDLTPSDSPFDLGNPELIVKDVLIIKGKLKNDVMGHSL